MTVLLDPTADRPQHLSTVAVSQHQSGGISLGAYNHIEQVGDLIAGDKITFVVYTGPAPAARRGGALLSGASLS